MVRAVTVRVRKKKGALLQGMCKRCGHQVPVAGKAACEECLEIGRLKSRETRERRREAGLCPFCGRPKKGETTQRCAHCLEARKAAAKKAARLGLCRVC